MRAIARAHRRFGTTACLPTLITDTREQMRTAIAAARSVAGRDGVLGLHLEGPFISPKRPGIHRPDRIAQPGAGDLEELCELAGAGRSLVTLAPECVPAGFVRTLGRRGRAGFDRAQRGVRGRRHAGRRRWRNRRHPSVQRHAAAERARAGHHRRGAGGAPADRRSHRRRNPCRSGFGPRRVRGQGRRPASRSSPMPCRRSGHRSTVSS